MKILAVLCQDPFTHIDGGTYGIRATLHQLSDKGDLYVAGYGESFNHSMVGGFRSAGSLGEVHNSRLEFLKALAVGRSYSVEKYSSREAKTRFAEIVAKGNYSVLWFDKLLATPAGYYTREKWQMPAGPRSVLRAHNIEHRLIHARFASNNPLVNYLLHVEAERLKKYELKVIEFVDQVFTLSSKDCEMLTEMRPNLTSRVDFLPLPVKETQGGEVRFDDKRETILFVGDCRWRPNLLAIEWIVEKLADALLEACPDLRIRLVGRGTDQFEKARPNIEGAGFVDDMEGEYPPALCTIAPIRTGSGMNAKVIESLQHGIPVVGTQFARRGIDSDAFLEAESAAEFVQRIAALRDDPAGLRALSLTARESALEAGRRFDEIWHAFRRRMNS